jgi:acetolactate synthase-1/3 small subunit
MLGKGLEGVIMQKSVLQLLADNTAGVISRITGLFSRRGYNIESLTAGVTADARFSRITIVASGDDEILEQIEKQVAKLVDVRDLLERYGERELRKHRLHRALLQQQRRLER